MMNRLQLRTLIFTCLCTMLFTTANAAEKLVTYKVMSPELALKSARAALQACRAKDAQVAVAVVDRGGAIQVVLRDRFAGPHTPDSAVSKAWTAVSFRTDTIDLVNQTKAGSVQSGARHIPGVTILGGGIKIEAAGSIVGAIGIAGSPTGKSDHNCAKAGVDAIADDLEL